MCIYIYIYTYMYALAGDVSQSARRRSVSAAADGHPGYCNPSKEYIIALLYDNTTSLFALRTIYDNRPRRLCRGTHVFNMTYS